MRPHSQITTAKTVECKPTAKSVFPKIVATELQISTVGVHTCIFPVTLLITLLMNYNTEIERFVNYYDQNYKATVSTVL